MGKITKCDALLKFIQEHCQSCSNEHCFGPACAMETGKCSTMKKDEPVKFGPPRIRPYP